MAFHAAADVLLDTSRQQLVMMCEPVPANPDDELQSVTRMHVVSGHSVNRANRAHILTCATKPCERDRSSPFLGLPSAT